MRLLVISSVIHYEWQGHVSSYGPYAREIDIWADLFSEVGIAAPLRHEPPPGDCIPFTRPNIRIVPQREGGGSSFQAKLKLTINVPNLMRSLIQEIRRYDAVHVRCPGNLGFLGSLLAPLFSSRMVAKYAGQWNGYPGEALSVRLQRRLLRSRYWRGPVTVYGRWPKQPAHVVPFFTSIMTREQLERAGTAACRRRESASLNVLFVGRLSAAKNVDTLIEALSELKGRGHAFSCSIIGAGPERERLEAMANQLEVSSLVRFTGGLAHDRVLEHMEHADVLVLASNSEGWPKAIAEGMVYGLVCVGSDRGFVPEMLADGRGLIVPAGDARKLAATLGQIAADPHGFEPMRGRAASWACRYSVDGLRDALAELLRVHWKLSLDDLQSSLPVELQGSTS